MKDNELIVAFAKLQVRICKEVNSRRGLTKKTEKEHDKICKELIKRGLLTQADVDEVNK